MTSKVVVLGFEGEKRANDMLGTFGHMEEQGIITLEDAVVASRNVSGNLNIEQTHSENRKFTLTGSGAGLLAGLLLGGPILGLAGGAAIGAITASLKDYGIDDGFIKQVSESLVPDSSAIFLLVQEAEGEKVLKELSEFKAVVLTTTLEPEQEKRLIKAVEK